MDMPKLHEYMSQYLTPLIASGKITLAEIGKNPQLEGCVVDLMSPAPSKMFAAILKDLEAKEVCVRVRVRVRVYFCISNCDRGGRAGQILMLRNGLLLVCLGVRSLKHRW